MGCTASKRRQKDENLRENSLETKPDRVLHLETFSADDYGENPVKIRTIDGSKLRTHSLEQPTERTQSDDTNPDEEEEEEKYVKTEYINRRFTRNIPRIDVQKAQNPGAEVRTGEQRQLEMALKRHEEKRKREEKRQDEWRQQQWEQYRERQLNEKNDKEKELNEELKVAVTANVCPLPAHESSRENPQNQSTTPLASKKSQDDVLRSRKSNAAMHTQRPVVKAENGGIPAIEQKREAVRQVQQSCIKRHDRARHEPSDDTLFEVPPRMPIVDFT